MLTLKITGSSRLRSGAKPEHRARTVASGVRTMFGTDAHAEQGNAVGPKATKYTITGKHSRKAGARPVLGTIIAYRD